MISLFKNKTLFFAVLAFIVLLSYSNALKNDFVLDDKDLIVNNQLIKAPAPWFEIFTSSIYGSPKTYRPMQVLLNILDYRIWGINPFGFHLTNILLHVFVCFLIYLVFSCFSTVFVAGLGSLLFAVHPVNISAVTYISSRADLLVSFFILLNVLFFFKFLKSGLRHYFYLSLFAAFLAFFCRENALIVPLYIILASLFAPKGFKSLKYCMPFFILSVLYVMFRWIIFGSSGLILNPEDFPLIPGVINFGFILFKYLSVLFFPFNLHMFRSIPFIISFTDPRFFLSIIFMASYIYVMFRARNNRIILFGLLWFIIGLVPVYFLFNAYPWIKRAMMAESWLYLSSAGVFLLFAGFVNRLSKLGNILFIAILVLCAGFTYTGNLYWKDDIIVYNNILKYLPESNPVRQNLIREYLNLKKYDEAYLELKKFIRDYPQSSLRYKLEGDYYSAIGSSGLAKKCYEDYFIINQKEAKNAK